MSRKKQCLSHNDNPALLDRFKQGRFIKHLCNVIVDCEAPKGIGINGYWGTGKTTTLMRIYHQFCNEHPHGKGIQFAHTASFTGKKVIPIWFEAWRHQHEALPIVALLNEIRSQISLWNKSKDEAKKLAGVSLLGALNIFDEVIKTASGGLLNPELGKIKGIGEQWEAERYLTALPSQAIHQFLEEAIDQLSGKDHRLVIFIDDLDRCRPEKALQLMEGIKVYLNLQNCIVVFGMDQRQVEQALVKALQLDKNYEFIDQKAERSKLIAHQAQEYLEKICQDIYHIPVPDHNAKTYYFTKLLSLLETGKDKLQHERELKKVLKKYDCLPANPRKIKALVNRISTVIHHCNILDNCEKISQDIKIRRDYTLLVALTVIHTFHRRVHEQLEKNPKFINVVIGYAKDDNTEISDLPTKYEPMKDIIPSFSDGADLPRNPSDINVFRLHELFKDLDTVTSDEIQSLLIGRV